MIIDYSLVIVVDKTLGTPESGTLGGETGLCFFADQQIDRSPTGSSVMARIPLAIAKRELRLGQSWTYHSVVSQACQRDAFVGTGIKQMLESNVAGQVFICFEHVQLHEVNFYNLANIVSHRTGRGESILHWFAHFHS